LLKNPIDLFFQVVALGPIEVTIVLQAPHDNPWSDTQLECESPDGGTGEGTQPTKHSIPGLGNQPFLRERISFGLLIRLLELVTFKEDISPAVEKDMSSFVKERKPQMVVGLVPEAQLYQCSCRRQPPRRPPHSCAGKFGDERDAYAGLIAFPSDN
jgi:hypothetical protein